MGKKLINKIIIILMMMVFSVCVMSINFEANALTLSEMSGKIDDFESHGNVSIETGTIVTEFSSLAKILTTVGAGILLIIITYMGIKYFISSPEEQAKLKGQLIGIVVSALVIFGAVSIWSIAISIFKDI